jgi:hypothetical protein
MSAKESAPTEMLKVMYFPKTDSSNIEQVYENWKLMLRVKHGQASSFLTSGVYHEVVDPAEPTLTGLTEGTLPYKAKEKAYLEAISESVKETRRLLLERPKIAATMLAHLSSECLAHCARAENWSTLVDAADDPLAIWTSMSVSLRTRTVGDPMRARKNIAQGYANHQQRETQTLASSYLKEHHLAAMTAIGFPLSLTSSKAWTSSTDCAGSDTAPYKST